MPRRKRKAIFRFGLFLALFVCIGPAITRAAFAESASAPVSPNNKFVPTVIFTAYVGDNGSASTWLTFDFNVRDLDGLMAAYSSATHCLRSSIHFSPGSSEDESASMLYAGCAIPLRHEWSAKSGTFDFRPLTQALSREGVPELDASISIPNKGFTSCDSSPVLVSPVRNNEVCNYQFNTSSKSVGLVRISFGYSRGRVLRSGGVLGFLLLSPLVLTVWLRRRALSAPPEAREAIVFSYIRFVRFGAIGGIFIWWAAVDLLQVFPIVSFWIAAFVPWNFLLADLLPWVVIWIPPAAIYLICLSLSAPIHRLRGTEYTSGQLFSMSFWMLAMFAFPMVAILLGVAIFLVSPRWGVVFAGACVLTFRALRLKVLRSRGMQVHALATGELHDRAVALASQAGVRLKQIYILSTERMRMANAFAHQANNILLTDYLLKNMNRREVDAVIAHEITHLKKKHLKVRQIILFVLVFACIFGSDFFAHSLPHWFPLNPLLYGTVIFIVHFVSRANEFAADAGAAKLTGDPASMITSLVKLARLNTTPLQWGRIGEKALTHPSTSRRISRLASEANIPESAVPGIVANAAAPPSEVYPLPETVAPSAKIFSTLYKARRNFTIAWTVAILLAAIPSGVALAARRAQLATTSLWIVDVLGLFLTLAVILVLSDVLPLTGLSKLEALLRRKAEKEGAPEGLPSGQFVALSPDAQPRIYELQWAWDLGFIRLSRDRLNYWGEEAKFSVSRGEIKEIRLGPGSCGWFETPAVYISWANSLGQSGVFNIRSMKADSMRQMSSETRALADELEKWHRGMTFSPSGPMFGPSANSPSRVPQEGLLEGQLGAPAFRSVTSMAPSDLVRPRALLRNFILIGLVAACVAFAAGLPFGFRHLFADGLTGFLFPYDYSGWYVVGVAVVVRGVQLWPYRRGRRPATRSQSFGTPASIPDSFRPV